MANILVFDTNSVSRRFGVALLRNHGNSVRDVGDAADLTPITRA